MKDISEKIEAFEKVRSLPLSELMRVAIHQESAAISPQTTPLIEIGRSLADENDRLRETLDLIANSGMDARQCMLAARAALKP